MVLWVERVLVVVSGRSIGYRKWFCGLSGFYRGEWWIHWLPQMVLWVERVLLVVSGRFIGYRKWFCALSRKLCDVRHSCRGLG